MHSPLCPLAKPPKDVTLDDFRKSFDLTDSAALTDLRFMRAQQILRTDGSSQPMGSTAWFEDAVAQPDQVRYGVGVLHTDANQVARCMMQLCHAAGGTLLLAAGRAPSRATRLFPLSVHDLGTALLTYPTRITSQGHLAPNPNQHPLENLLTHAPQVLHDLVMALLPCPNHTIPAHLLTHTRTR